MKITSIRCINFRNFSQLDVTFDPERSNNFIIAPNGMGKSNLLEALYYTSYARTFRQSSDRDLIKKGQKFFFIESVFQHSGAREVIKYKYSSSKEILINNKKVKKHSEILGRLLTVLFSNSDLFIINGAPSIRRRFFDTLLSVIDREYLAYLKRYTAILKQKNISLKNESEDLIKVYNMQLSQIIVKIAEKRIALVEKVNAIFQELFGTIGLFQEKVKIVYSPSIKKKEPPEILKELELHTKQELEKGYSLYGSHKDNYLFLLNGVPFARYASLGQTRLAALVLKLCQARLYSNRFHSNPVLLLDDVILELDPDKKRRFLEYLPPNCQMFITLTDRKHIDWLDNKEYTVLEIDHGQIQ